MDVLSRAFNEREVTMGAKQEGRLLLLTLKGKKSTNVPVSPGPGPHPVGALPLAQADLCEDVSVLPGSSPLSYSSIASDSPRLIVRNLLPA